MIKVKFKVRYDDAFIFGRYSYIEVVDPIIEINDRHIIVKGAGGGIVAVLHYLDRLIFVSAKPYK